jgi:hypothetical protein
MIVSLLLCGNTVYFLFVKNVCNKKQKNKHFEAQSKKTFILPQKWDLMLYLPWPENKKKLDFEKQTGFSIFSKFRLDAKLLKKSFDMQFYIYFKL